MATRTLFYLGIMCFHLGVLTMTTTVSSQTYSFMSKDYFLVKERKTFADALTFCKSRGGRLIEIKSRAENEFVWAIVKTLAVAIWLGATNILGTKNFKYLKNGSDVGTQYTNWYKPDPWMKTRQRNAIVMQTCWEGKWGVSPVSDTGYALCERDKSALHSKLTEPTEQTNASGGQLMVVASTQRKEYLQLIMEVKQDYKSVHDRLDCFGKNQNNGLVQQNDVNVKLKSQVNDMATELEFQKKHSSQLVTELNTDIQNCKKMNEQLANRITINDKRNEMLIEQINLLERRFNRLEQKIYTDNVKNSNRIE